MSISEKRLDEFEAFMKADEQAGLASKTLRLYRDCVRISGRQETLTAKLEGDLSRQRKDSYKKALIWWARFTEDDELLAEVKAWKPTKKERKEKRRKDQPLALDIDSEWVPLRNTISKLEDPILRAVLMLVATSGLRIAEVFNLTGANLRSALKIGSARISGKGDKERYFIVATAEPRSACRDLSDRLGDAEHVVDVLYTKRRTKWKSVESHIIRRLEELAKEVGIEKKIHPHMLRRTVGDAMYRATGDYRAVAEALGNDVETVKKYYQDHVHVSDTAAAYRAALKEKS